jgi:hypothetical protein
MNRTSGNLKLAIYGSTSIKNPLLLDEVFKALEENNVIKAGEELEYVAEMEFTLIARRAKELAKKHNWKVSRFKADWNKNGNIAGKIRDREIIDYADALIALWDGESKGVKSVMDYAVTTSKPVLLFLCSPDDKGSWSITGSEILVDEEFSKFAIIKGE